MPPWNAKLMHPILTDAKADRTARTEQTRTEQTSLLQHDSAVVVGVLELKGAEYMTPTSQASSGQQHPVFSVVSAQVVGILPPLRRHQGLPSPVLDVPVEAAYSSMKLMIQTA